MSKKAKIKPPVQRGQEITLTIHGIGTNGEGVGKYEGFTVFVLYALPDETVRVTIDVVKATYSTGRLLEVLVPSPNRVQPPCKLYGQCGGCQLQHVSYEGQLAIKTQKVRDVIERIAQQDPALVKDCLGPADPWAYRNKMQMPVGITDNQLAMGFYERGSHRIVNGTTCLIQQDGNNEIAKACYEIANQLHMLPYNELTGEGVLRHVVGRIGKNGWMVILVTATDTLPQADTWVEQLRARLPQVVSIVHNVNPRKTNVILGSTNHVLWGTPTMEDEIKDLVFTVSPHSFFQVNPTQTTVLYDQALQYANLTGNETVVDAYCGTGTISLFLARQAKDVIGIEIVEPAIVDARKNATRNGVTNAQFIVGDAGVEMPKLYDAGVRPQVVVVDPVRAGCNVKVLNSVANMESDRIVYVSCNPATMSRDIAILVDNGYALREVQPVDMFPMTAHVEAVALLVKTK